MIMRKLLKMRILNLDKYHCSVCRLMLFFGTTHNLLLSCYCDDDDSDDDELIHDT